MPRRPVVHVTPPTGWLNDPNGLVYADGVYHLCYQHHPYDLSWGPMHWGHATSVDLVSWEHGPIVLSPDRLGAVFSGSAVVDRDGVAGFGPGALVAFYTHWEQDVPQAQGVAVSADGGRTWRPHPDNPVLRAPAGLVDFRDPKVLRYGGDGPEGWWVMVVVAGDEVALYRSDDLLHWEPASTFGRGHGAHGGVWETPDLLELEIEGTGERRWVLVVSVLGGGPCGGSGTQWFLGSFDGVRFTCDDDPAVVRWVDEGPDFYAPQSWFGAPDGRRLWLAWLNNWDYARTTPADTWRGMLTVPRDLALRDDDGSLLLVQRPAPEVVSCGPAETWTDVAVDGRWVPDAVPGGVAAAVELHVAVPSGGRFAVEALGGAVRFDYDAAEELLTFRRSVIGLTGAVAAARSVPLRLRDGVLELVLVVDTCSVELFAADGAVVVTQQVFPVAVEPLVALVADTTPVHVRSLLARAIGPALPCSASTVSER